MKRQWEFVIDVDRLATVPPFRQIARKLTDDIRRGRLRPDDRLPGSRRLASTLGVHRNTVLAAYAELVAEGWIETAQGRGTFVSAAIPEVQGRPFGKTVATRQTGPPRARLRFPDAPEAYRPLSLARGTLDLSSGAPDIRLVPARLIGRAYRRVLANRAVDVLVTLKAARRMDILAMAQSSGFAIVEDDYDHEFHYDGRPVLPIASVDHGGVVVYIGTLSKVLAPGLRVGYIVASTPVLQRVAAIRSLLDIQGDLATEAAVAAMIEDGDVQRHIARVRRIYAERRAALSVALRRTLGTLVEFDLPAGGMAMWLKFDKGAGVDAWARRSLEHGVSWYTGRRYAFDQQPHPFARLSFASLNEREIAEAMKRMAAARR